MKYCEFEKSGIHSRLRNIIKLSGGYDYRLAGELLMREFGISNQEIAYEMAKNENIRDEINSVGLESVIELTYESIKIWKLRLAGLTKSINRIARESNIFGGIY